LAVDESVAEQLALLRANRERRQAIEALDQGNLHAAAASLASIDQHLAALPQSDAVVRERQLLKEKQELLQQDRNLSRKRLRRESLRSSLSVWEGGDDNG
jgi:Ca-activated chloride channel family protein